METLSRPVPTDALSDTASAPLALGDRCDRCGARAYVRATLPSGQALLLCGHHGNAHRAALLVAGAALHDETAQLVERRESSAAS